MSHNKRKSMLEVENRASRDIRTEQDKKQSYQRELSRQVQERLARKEEEKAAEALAEQKLKRQLQEMEVNVQKHISKHTNKVKSSQSKKDTLGDVINSNANCINTALSMNYVLKHRDTTDYNTLTEPLEPRPDIMRNDSSKQAKMRELKARLQSAKQEAFAALEEKEKSEAKLFELKAKLIQMKHDKEGYMNKLKTALHQTKVDEKSHVFVCDTAFVPVEAGVAGSNAVEHRKARNSVEGNRAAYKINSGVRRWSSRQPNSRCEQEIRELHGLIDNYYRK